MIKRCTRCSEIKSVSQFSKWIRAKDGLQSQCKACCKIYRDELRQRDPDYDRRSKKKHAEKIKARKRIYRQLNVSSIKAYHAKYYSLHVDENRARNTKWRKEHPGYHCQYYAENTEACKAKDHRRRARKIGAAGEISHGIIDVLMSEQGSKCPYCFSSLNETGWHLDHYLPLALGGRHDDKNLQLTCPTCNRKKCAKDPVKFLKEAGITNV